MAFPLLEGLPRCWDLYGGVLGTKTSARSLCFRQLPSRLRGIEFREWGVGFEYTIADFFMDPSQDLLVLIQKCLKCVFFLISFVSDYLNRFVP